MGVITGLLVDVYNQKIEKRIIEFQKLSDYRKKLQEFLQCEFFEMKQVPFFGINCYITFDEIGKVRKDRESIPGVILVNKESLKICDWIAGNVWVEGYDGGEDIRSLTDKEIEDILDMCIDKVRVYNNLTGSSYSTQLLVSLADWIDIRKELHYDETYM